MVNLKPCVQLLTILLSCPLSALRGGEQCDEVAERGEVIGRCWIQYGEGGESARPGWGETLWTLTNSCTIVL